MPVSLSQQAVTLEGLVVKYGEAIAVRGVDLSIKSGEHFTMLGASGCGKTTTLRAIAGLEQPSAGRISLFGNVVFDAERGIDVPPEKRGVSMVFQSYAIWPHMSVFDNVSYGLRLRRLPKAEIRRRTREALDLVGLLELAERSSVNLSGGQQQRVALARSFVFEPKVVLFDEPLSNLDARLRAHMRTELKQLEKRLKLTTIYVTHDQDEALAMSDTIAVMEEGQVVQVGDPFSLYFRPANAHIAQFVGSSNLLDGVVVGSGASDGTVAVRLDNDVRLDCATCGTPQSGRVRVAIKTVHVTLGAGRDPASGDRLSAVVTRRYFAGDVVEYHLDWAGLEVRARQLALDIFEEGQPVSLTIAAGHAVLLPAT